MIKAVAGPIQIEGGRKVLREKKEGSEMGRPTIRGVSCLLQACTEAIIQNGHRFSLMLSTWTLDNHLAHLYHILDHSINVALYYPCQEEQVKSLENE